MPYFKKFPGSLDFQDEKAYIGHISEYLNRKCLKQFSQYYLHDLDLDIKHEYTWIFATLADSIYQQAESNYFTFAPSEKLLGMTQDQLDVYAQKLGMCSKTFRTADQMIADREVTVRLVSDEFKKAENTLFRFKIAQEVYKNMLDQEVDLGDNLSQQLETKCAIYYNNRRNRKVFVEMIHDLENYMHTRFSYLNFTVRGHAYNFDLLGVLNLNMDEFLLFVEMLGRLILYKQNIRDNRYKNYNHNYIINNIICYKI